MTQAGYSLKQIASMLRKQAAYIEYGEGEPISLRTFRQLANALSDRHDHGDPCDDLACPCRKAEADCWRDQGLARP